MTDLNVTLFYKAHFQVSTPDPDNDLLWNLILKIRNWQCRKWQQRGENISWKMGQWSNWKKGCTFRSKNGIVTLISEYYQDDDGRVHWACKVVESPDGESGYAPREWVTEIGFRQTPQESADLSIVIFYRDRPGFIGLCAPLPDASVPGPKLIQSILEDPKLECTVGGTPVSQVPALVSPESWPAFRAVVLDPERTVPVVYLSPKRLYPDGEEASPLLNPTVLAKILGPNALVFYGTSLEVSRLMTADSYEQILGCYSGGIRVYAANPKKDWARENLRHRYLSGAFVQEQGANEMYALLRRALAQDISAYASVFRVEDCRSLKRRARLEKTLEEEFLEDAVKTEVALKEEIKKIQQECLEWEEKLVSKEEELEGVKYALYQQQSRADNFQAAAAKSKLLEQSLKEVREISTYPQKPEEVVHFFLTHFSDRLVFTERGLKSLRECTTDAATLWEALYAMSTTLYDLYYSNDCLEIDRVFANKTPHFSLATNAGMMTRKDKKLYRQYWDKYDKRDINVETHLRSRASKESDKNFLRIYYCYDPQTEKLVISSCGKHLDTFSTGKMH